MNVTQITFSPTGGTARVADIITSAWRTPVHKIDLSHAQTADSLLNLGKEELAGPRLGRPADFQHPRQPNPVRHRLRVRQQGL